MKTFLKIALTGVAVLAVAIGTWLLNPEPEQPAAHDSAINQPFDGILSAPSADRQPAVAVPEVSSAIRFQDVASAAGVEFVYYGSPSPDQYMTEQNGGGIAVFDYDADGIVDLFFSNGSHFEDKAESQGATDVLYRASAPLKYEAVTSLAALERFGFGQGCAAADYDNDGFSDLFVCCFGKNHLWRNNGDGTFSDVTDAAGAGDEHWATSAAFADLDADGLLDLYVVNYVDWTPDAEPCFLDKSQERRKVCSPLDFHGQSDLLLKNNGDGTFVPTDSFQDSHSAIAGKGLAIAMADLNADSMLDIFVANDTMQNFLFVNKGSLTFEESAVSEGIAFSQDGSLGSSMGIAVGDYDRNSFPDLFVTNFAHEVIDAITNLGPNGFIANNAELGLDASSTAVLNFGIVMADFDLDQWPDLFFTNGHLWDSGPGGDEYRMRPNVLQNHEGRFFSDVSDSAGSYFNERWLGRAVAAGDLDNDGDTDLVVGQLLDPAALLENTSQRQGHSVLATFIGTKSCRQPLGCQVDAQLDNGITVTTHIPSGGSFQASHDVRIVIPVGASREITRLSIHWPGGPIESWSHLSCEAGLTLIEGTGQLAQTLAP